MAPPRTRTVPVGFDQPPSSKKARRVKTTSAKLEVSGQDNPEWRLPRQLGPLRRRVFEEVVNRLRNANSVVSDLSIEALEWMLPNGNAESWECLLLLPMMVTDEDMQAMMNLERSTAETPNPPAETSIYYIRSFELTRPELQEVIDQLEKDDNRTGSKRLTAWKEALELAQSGCNIFIRYVGMSGRVSAFARFAEDLQYRVDGRGFYGKFMDTLGEVAPHVVADCKVFTVPHTKRNSFRLPSGQLMPLPVEDIDVPERVLVELLGSTTLLNSRSGGKYSSYHPSDADVGQFQKLKTNAFEKLERMIRSGQLTAPDNLTQAHVISYASEVRALGQMYPEELGTDRIPASDLMEIACAEEATYAQCYGETIFLLVGDYLPLSAMYNPAPYWKQLKSRSVMFMKNALARLQATEQNKPTWHQTQVSKFIDLSLLPFVDFQSTPKHKSRLSESSSILRKYIATAKPLLVLSFEQRTSAVIGTNFLGVYKGKRLTHIAGIPRIQYSTDPGQILNAGTANMIGENAPQPDDAFIQIPCVHPGSLAYTDNVEINRVVDMTLWQLLLGFDVVLDLLHGGFTGTRAELCETTMRLMEERWEASGCANALAEAKDALNSVYASKYNRWDKDAHRQPKPQLNGTEVIVTQEGKVNLFWKAADSTRTIKAVITAGRKGDIPPPKDAQGWEKIRTIHFLSTGIDIRTADGTSCTYTRSSHAYTNPTFPGQIIHDKVYTAKQEKSEHLIDIWESETGLDFEETFPQDGSMQSIGFNKPDVTARYHVPPSRKNATVSKVKSSTAASARNSAATKAAAAGVSEGGFGDDDEEDDDEEDDNEEDQDEEDQEELDGDDLRRPRSSVKASARRPAVTKAATRRPTAYDDSESGIDVDDDESEDEMEVGDDDSLNDFVVDTDRESSLNLQGSPRGDTASEPEASAESESPRELESNTPLDSQRSVSADTTSERDISSDHEMSPELESQMSSDEQDESGADTTSGHKTSTESEMSTEADDSSDSDVDYDAEPSPEATPVPVPAAARASRRATRGGNAT